MRELIKSPAAFVQSLLAAIKSGDHRKATELAIPFLEAGYHYGAAEPALEVAKRYLKKWSSRRDDATGEVKLLAANLAARLGESRLAESILRRLLPSTLKDTSGGLQRRALQSLAVVRSHQGHHKESRLLYQRALRLAILYKDEYGEAQISNNLASSTDDLKEATRLARRSIALKKRLGLEEDAAGTLATLGALLAKQGKLLEGERTLDKSIQLAKRAGAYDALAVAFLNRGSIALDRKDTQGALKWMRRGLKAAQAAQDVAIERMARQGLAVACYQSGRYTESARHFQRLAVLCDLLGDRFDAAMAHHDQGSNLLLSGNETGARKEYEEAVRRFREIGNRTWTIISLLNLIDVVPDEKERRRLAQDVVAILPTKADGLPVKQMTQLAVRLGDERFTRRALKLERQTYDHDGKSRSRWAWRVGVLGDLARQNEHWQLATELFEEAIALYGKEDAPEVAGQLENDLGTSLMEQAESRKALRHFMRAFSLGMNHRNRVLSSQAAHNIGETYRRLGRYAEAVQWFTTALEMSQRLKDKAAVADTLHSLGLVYVEQSRLDDASKLFKEVQGVADALDNAHLKAQAAMGRAAVSFANEDYRGAERCYLDAFRFFQQDASPSSTKALYDAGLAATKAGNDDKAARHYMRCIRLAMKAGDMSSASLGLVGLVYLSVGNRRMKDAAEALAQSLALSILPPDRTEAFRTSLDAYVHAARAFGKKNPKLRERLTSLVIERLKKMPQPEVMGVIVDQVEETHRVLAETERAQGS